MKILAAQRPFDGIQSDVLAAAVDVDAGMAFADFLVIDRDRDALVAEGARSLADEFGTPDGLRVDGNLVGARAQQPVDVLQRADATAHRERHEYLLRHSFDDL